ncbi:MAG: hypothetical protein ACAI43_18325 [Phycisphaerae bacterium]
MTKPPAEKPELPVAAIEPESDLSAQIALTVAREPLDHVKCVRVYDDFYRCNWWAPEPTPGGQTMPAWGMLSTHRVRKSTFMSAVLRAGRLELVEIRGTKVEDPE